MTSAPYPEPKGYSTAMGFVKSNPLNNDFYVEQWKDDPWYWIIKDTHERLTRLIPGYNIAQIKEKFGGLRFYYDEPDWGENLSDEQVRNLNQAAEVVRRAEWWVMGYETAKREARNA